MKIFQLLIMFILLSIYGCSNATDLDSADTRILNAVNNGESGYHSGIELSEDIIRYQFRNFNREDFETTVEMNRNQWRTFMRQIDLNELRALSQELSCDICPVDGSSETITVVTTDDSVTVIMDADEAVAEIEDLLTELRNIRAALEELR